jgi:hypothetical protein
MEQYSVVCSVSMRLPAQLQQTTQTESQDQDDFEVTPGVESRADLLFKDQDGGKAILVDVTSASGLSRYVKLHRYFPGAVAELAEQRKAKAYSRLWNVESERARLIFSLWNSRATLDQKPSKCVRR